MSIELKPISEIPPAKRQKKGSMYDKTLKQFLKSDANASEVIIKSDSKPSSIATALKNRISVNKEFSDITVAMRKIDGKVRVFLQKK